MVQALRTVKGTASSSLVLGHLMLFTERFFVISSSMKQIMNAKQVL